ncbi:DAK2 domain-containing protein [Candidatus Hakubella thermalkaliphila]|nr:DAK2 domain-containing protein [Candidatus Hakubella thermalkaliphila]
MKVRMHFQTKKFLTAEDLVWMFKRGLENLKESEEYVNELNVFPVPDGDTGTNLVLTMQAVVDDIDSLDNLDMRTVAAAISQASLMGARGNSGVILSQIFRGICEVIQDKEAIDSQILGQALDRARDISYKAVMKPVEGTMLTVIKDVAGAASIYSNDSVDLVELLVQLVDEAERSVQETINLLPVLKEAGVVDAGGVGLLAILRGFLDVVRGEKELVRREKVGVLSRVSPTAEDVEESLEYRYCTEFVIKGEKIDLDHLKEEVNRLGDCALVVGSPNTAKVHVHTNEPHVVLSYALKEGSLHNITINNMDDQASERAKKLASKEVKEVKELGVLAVCSGEGLREIFLSLGADGIVNGGQTMNPSTKDILDTVEKVSARSIFILPNNKNIILTAEQAGKVSDKKMVVIPTKSIAQGISAVLSFNQEMDVEENRKSMLEAMERVKSGEITFAIRDSESKIGKITRHDVIGICNGEIRAIGRDLVETSLDLIGSMVGEEDEILTIYKGEGSSDEDTELLADRIKKLYPHLEVELHEGGQPLYPYLFSLE